MVTGYSLLDSGFKTNAGTIFVTFSDFDERYKDIATAQAAERARDPRRASSRRRSEIEGAIVLPIAPPAIPGIGTTGGFEFWIQDTGTGDPVALEGVLQDFLKKARERPELTGLATTYSASHAAAARRRRPRQGARCWASRSRTSTARSRRSSGR